MDAIIRFSDGSRLAVQANEIEPAPGHGGPCPACGEPPGEGMNCSACAAVRLERNRPSEDLERIVAKGHNRPDLYGDAYGSRRAGVRILDEQGNFTGAVTKPTKPAAASSSAAAAVARPSNPESPVPPLSPERSLTVAKQTYVCPTFEGNTKCSGVSNKKGGYCRSCGIRAGKAGKSPPRSSPSPPSPQSATSTAGEPADAYVTIGPLPRMTALLIAALVEKAPLDLLTKEECRQLGLAGAYLQAGLAVASHPGD